MTNTGHGESRDFFNALAVRLSISCPGCEDPPLSGIAIIIDRHHTIDEAGKMVYPKVKCIKCGFVGIVPESWVESRIIG